MISIESSATEKSAINRRSFFGAGGLVATAAAVATVLHGGEVEAMQTTPKQKAARYQDSAHVQRFYALNRR
jgi:hypothetical protein